MTRDSSSTVILHEWLVNWTLDLQVYYGELCLKVNVYEHIQSWKQWRASSRCVIVKRKRSVMSCCCLLTENVGLVCICFAVTSVREVQKQLVQDSPWKTICYTENTMASLPNLAVMLIVICLQLLTLLSAVLLKTCLPICSRTHDELMQPSTCTNRGRYFQEINIIQLQGLVISSFHLIAVPNAFWRPSSARSQKWLPTRSLTYKLRI